MRKPKIKIRELKPKIKIIKEITPEQTKTDSLETVVEVEGDKTTITVSPHNSAQTPNPTLTQKFDIQERQFEQTKREEKKQNEAIAYHMLNQPTSSRDYNPTIKSGLAPVEAGERINPVSRVNPTIRSNNPIEQVGRSNDIRDNLTQTDVEPSMRRLRRDGERDYQVERAETYVAKRRTDMM